MEAVVRLHNRYVIVHRNVLRDTERKMLLESPLPPYLQLARKLKLWAGSREGATVGTSSPPSGGGSATPPYGLHFLWAWYLKSTLTAPAFPQGALLTAMGKRAAVTMIISSR